MLFKTPAPNKPFYNQMDILQVKGVVDMLVKNIMTKKVVTLKPDETLKEVSLKFSERDISGAPVVDDEGHVIGIVSEADIIAAIERSGREVNMVYLSPALSMVGLSFKETPSNKKTEEIFEDVGNIKVSEMMKHNVKTVGPDDQVKVVINIVASGKINRVPVVKNGKLVGIVTRGDILKRMSKMVK
jgi:CBS domain-containing protein